MGGGCDKFILLPDSFLAGWKRPSGQKPADNQDAENSGRSGQDKGRALAQQDGSRCNIGEHQKAFSALRCGQHHHNTPVIPIAFAALDAEQAGLAGGRTRQAGVWDPHLPVRPQ